MSTDTQNKITEPIPVSKPLNSKVRLHAGEHGLHHVNREDEWERRMKLLNPHWQPHRYLTTEIS